MADTVPATVEPDAAVPVEPAALHGCPTVETYGDTVVHPSREQYVELLRHLLDDGYVQCLDLFGVDYLTHPGRRLPDGVAPERFEVVLSLLNLDAHHRLRVRVQVPESEPVLPSLFELWPGTEAMERETFDMFGIEFMGHPDLTRILMPEDWVGHPLRKDYDVGEIPVQFSGAHTAPAPGDSR
jgi:NADH-quinone oxidoreductase subunit C